jgi:alkanesulfonate monooxygenase SsuD/methylene tetrahydromethanopterin reductase-like flavin-dependent oxidoreductase (luciferase family)
MRVGLGVPNSIPGTTAGALVEWARRAEEGPFSTLGVLDRVRYDSYEPMTTLGALAVCTQRIGLASAIVIGPLRNTAVLGKEAATVDALSGGRLTLGLAVGARRDDYEAAGVGHADRGRRFADQLVELRRMWERDDVGPAASSSNGPPILVGGTSDVALARMARHGDGYIHNGGPPRAFSRAAASALTAWEDAGRPGRPPLWGQGYFALGGEEAIERGRHYMLDYYSFTGAFAHRIAEGMLTTPQSVLAFVRGYREAGCDELLLMPAVADVEQVERLADVLSGG